MLYRLQLTENLQVTPNLQFTINPSQTLDTDMLWVIALLLAALDRMNPFVDLGLAIKRTILVAFPASFSATVVDSLS